MDNVLWGGTVIDDSRHDDVTKAIRALNTKINVDAADWVWVDAGGEALKRRLNLSHWYWPHLLCVSARKLLGVNSRKDRSLSNQFTLSLYTDPISCKL